MYILACLSLALRACGIKSGDHVIVPSFTFIATWLAVSEIGAIPIPVECDPESCLIDIKDLERCITHKVKAIVPVHLYGSCVNIHELIAFARAHRIKIVEDAAKLWFILAGKRLVISY